MKIKISYFGVGTPSLPLELEAEEHTKIKDLLPILGKYINDPLERLENSATFLVNKQKANAETTLKDNDSVLILHVLGGG